MFPRSSSTSSCRQSLNENHPLPHYESLQNLYQVQRQKSSHPLTLDNNHLNLPVVPDPIKENAPVKTEHLVANEKKPDQLRRTIAQDDMENIQERLNEMLIAVPSINENEKQFLKQQKSTNEYFTPKVSIDDEDDEQFDLTNNEIDSATHPFFDVLTTTTYEKEVMKYLLNLESRFMTENDKLRSAKRLRESTNTLKPIEGIPTPGCHSSVIITSKVRCKLIDWMISVHDYHRLNAAILCRTIHLIDRILLLNDQMTKLDLQLRAVNCFTIACKLESRRVPDVNSLLALFDSRYHVTPNHLNHGEKQLLTQLDFELEYPLAIHFLCYYLRFIPFHFVIYSLSKYMIECALCDEILSEEMPGSLLAAASLLLSLKFTRQLDNLQITKRFYKHQPYKHEELEKSIEKILKLMQQVPKSLYHTNVREKYKRSEFDRVATYQYSNDLGK
ncbi:unnamed protein product [Adineta ricciae]|uniref:Cyclin C-terminal domain-containing protein n=1 Tax=Adineta ricciae TaxID=249248 RepID=A0A815VQY5_ADIRI|nr:unnamed protein product [Adineta ricciae]